MLTKGTEVIIQVDSNWRMQHHSKHNVQGDKEKARLRQGVLAGWTDEWVCSVTGEFILSDCQFSACDMMCINP